MNADWTKHDFLARFESKKRENPKHNDTTILVGLAKDLYRAIVRGGLDISPCRKCSQSVVCLPDGLCMCAECAAKEAK